MLRAVIDTSVLVRAFLRDSGSDWKVYEAFLEGKVDVYYSQEIVDEFVKTMKYPRLQKRVAIANKSVEIFMEELFENGKLKKPETIDICRDKWDNYVLGLAMAAAKGKSVCLVTGDKDILVLKGKIKGIEIMTASEFIRIST